MTLKNFLSIFLAISVFLVFSGCTNTDTLTKEPSDTETDKYGCVMFNSIKNIVDDSITVKTLSPKGALKYAVRFALDGEERIINGESVSSDGALNKIAINYGESEYVVTVGSNVLNDTVVVKGCLDEDNVLRVEINNELFDTITLPEEFGIVAGHSEVYVDALGYIHIANVIHKDDGKVKNSYFVIKNKKIVFRRDLEEGACKLIIFPDMNVAADLFHNTSEGKIDHEIIQFIESDSSYNTVCSYSTEEKLKGNEIIALNVFDENHLVYITCKGVYLSDYKTENAELLFDWHKNGVSFVSEISPFGEYRVCANDQGDIFVLKNGSWCDEYLKLSKLPENITIVEIAGVNGLRSYSKAVFNFNISHPEYHITIRDDYDKTILQTKLISGEGPEIIESGVVDEQSQKNMWEPLGNLVSEDTIANLNKGAIICGSIDGELLGAAPCFAIDTLVTGDCFEKWDYDTFIQSIKTNPNLKTITGNSLLEGKLQILRYLFCDGIDDTYFIDHNDQTYTINRDRLEETAFLIEKYQNDENLDKTTFDMVANKSMLCMRFLVFRPIDLYYILYAFNDKGYVTGYPGKNGAKHYLFDSGTLFVRKNISDEKRKVISEFFEYMLSYEGQSSMYIDNTYDGFSARDDVLNEQINAMKEREGEMAGLGNVMFLLKDIDTEYAKEEIDKIIEKSIPEQDWDDPFYTIIWEEFDDYFSGNIDMDTLEDHLSKRIEIYINERQ